MVRTATVALVLASGCGGTSAVPAPPPVERSVALVDPVRVHLEDPGHWTWSARPSARRGHCVDSASGESIASSVGGDAGELVVALAALELAGHPLGEEDVAREVDAFAASFGAPHLPLDHRAIPALAALLGEGAIDRIATRPDAALEGPLLAQLVSPDHVGCALLRGALLRPSEYGVRRALVEATLSAIARRGWREGRLEIDWTAPAEAAVVHVRSVGPAVEHVAPLAGLTIRVLEPRSDEAERATRRAHWTRRGAHTDALDALEARHAAATLRHLARELPVYEARVGADGIQIVGPDASLGCRGY